MTVIHTNYAPIRIIIADDHELLRDAYRNVIRKEAGMELVADAVNGEQLVQLVGRHLPDIVITDIMMPVKSGVEATRIITRDYPQVSVIAFSFFHHDHFIIDMLQAGVKGYLSKSATKKEIVEAIITVHHNQSYFCNLTSTRVNKLIAQKNITPNYLTAREIFSDNEREVITLICKEYSNKDISAALSLSVRTIEGYRERILEKTNSKNVAGIILYAVRNNLYIPGDDD